MPASRLVNRNVIAARGRTSMRLEPEFWAALGEICRRERTSMGVLIRRIEAERGLDSAGADREGEGGRTSAVRVFVLQYFRTGLPVSAQGAASLARRDVGVAA